LLVGLVLTMALVACGGGDEKVPAAAEDKAQAERIVLTEADVPDLTRTEEEDSDDGSEPFQKCLNDNVLLTKLGDGPRSAESSFGNEDETIVRASAVNLAESEGDAMAAFAELNRANFVGCFEEAVRTAFEEELSGSFSNLEVIKLPVEKVGDDTVAFRTTLDLELVRSLALSLDYVFFRVGRGLGVLFSVDVDGTLDAAERTRLVKAIAGRLEDA